MSSEISNVAKYVFLLHFIVALIFGAFWFLLPEYWSTLSGWPVEYAAGRIVGMAALVMAVGSFFAYQKTTWDQVEVYVIMELVFNILGTIAMLWNVLTMTLPIIAWVLIGITGIFAVLFLYVYFKR